MTGDAHDYPPFLGPRRSIRAARDSGGGLVAGRWAGGSLEDESATCPIDGGIDAPDGSWVAGTLIPSKAGWTLGSPVVHTPQIAPPSSPDRSLSERRPLLVNRDRVLGRIREFFSQRGFLHVETPSRVVCPAVEEHLEAFPAGDHFLATSPELHLKRLLAAGYEKVYELARVFRNDEGGRHHLSEFTMLEWYRAWGSLEHVMTDCEELIRDLCGVVGRTPPNLPFERLSYREAFLRYAGFDPLAAGTGSDSETLSAHARRLGTEPAPGEDPDELLARIFVHAVDPRLANHGALFLTDFPGSQAALARLRDHDGVTTAGRFELYLDGLELANAFDELTDPREQRARIDEMIRRRRGARRPEYPIDRLFLRALEAGMPPSAGIALGVDRLVMWLLGAARIQDVVAFPPEWDTGTGNDP